MFGITRESALRDHNAQKQEDKGPIDEVKALKDIFYDFFNANSQAHKKQKDVLVSMTFHEMNINPFHIASSAASNLPGNVVQADDDDERFGHLLGERKFSSKGNLEQINEENNEASAINDSAEAPSDDGDKGYRQQMPPPSRKSTISGLSVTTSRRKEEDDSFDEYDEDKKQPWVDNFKPRLAPDWTEIYNNNID